MLGWELILTAEPHLGVPLGQVEKAHYKYLIEDIAIILGQGWEPVFNVEHHLRPSLG